MYRLRFGLLALMLMASSCSTVDAIFGPAEPEVAVAPSKEKIVADNAKLETEISALRASLRKVKSDIASKKAGKAQASSIASSEEKVASDNVQLGSEIADLRGSLQSLKQDMSRKKARKAQEMARIKAAEAAGRKATAAIPKDRLWVTVSFRSGYMELTSDSRNALKRLAAKFLSKPRQQNIEIRGYTDDEPIGGYAYSRHTSRHPYKTNMALSKARAQSVADALISAGLSPRIVTTRGFGDSAFVASNKTDAGRQSR